MFQHFRYRIAVVQEGKEPLTHCNLCVMNMPAGWLIKHLRKERCNQNMHMRWQRRDLDIAAKCMEETFSLTGKNGAECFEGL